MSNFSFLENEFPNIYREAKKAETYTLLEPKFGALLCRTVLELSVNWLYDNEGFEMPYDTKLSSLMHQDDFRNSVPPLMFKNLNLIRKIGNNAAHGKRVDKRESFHVLKNTYSFCVYLSRFYSINDPDIPRFDESLIPKSKIGSSTISVKAFEAEVQRAEELTTAVQAAQKEKEDLARQNASLRAALEAQRAELNRRKEARQAIVDLEDIPRLTTEQETRKLYIDVALAEAGWQNLKMGVDLEFPVTGMPKSTNSSGRGYVDYVLWGDNGLPLAVVEAKSTLHEADRGRHQAQLYADALEGMYGQRPIIFYTNGYTNFLWDDQFYTPRAVDGFYTKDELDYLIFQRKNRKDLRDFKVNPDIAGRPYQMEAIQRVAEALVSDNPSNNRLIGRKREALLVMATGSGKTRTACAIVDMLTRNNWAKRILFLADRNALVAQAKNAFKEHLPHLSGIDLTKEKEDNGTKLVFSTYPTIMNKIDHLRSEDGRFYGVGHFDLIIIDEAHRSVYQKYQAIFNYFDSLLIGLTATPKKDVHHDTYGLFHIEDDNPTFAYELNDAVKQGFLVPPKGISVPVKFIREGIKYNALSPEDKEKFEELFDVSTLEDEDDLGIDKNEINQFFFNNQTVDLVLDYLMTNGLKVNGGDLIGKTIIFAKNHNHAKFIEKRFHHNYPQYGGDFLSVIDNYESKAQNLLERFCDDKEDLLPQIAVSVDMMDTGVDAPKVLNLVFFKSVKSSAKYWQMVGRGTRLRPNIFGPKADKSCFLIFDICKNFEFFDAQPDGIQSSQQRSISELIFEAKLKLILAIRNNTNASPEEDLLAKNYTDDLHRLILALDTNRFEVKRALASVAIYQKRENWDNLSMSDTADIIEHLAPLATDFKSNQYERRFELLSLRLQLALIEQHPSQETYIGKILNIGTRLQKKRNIPAIASKIETIRNISDPEYWQTVNIAEIDEIQKDIKSLLVFLDNEDREIVYTDFQDFIDIDSIKDINPLTNYQNLEPYRNRVQSFIRKHKSHIVINKLHKNIPITIPELKLLESLLYQETQSDKARFEQEFQTTSLGSFIRSIVGLDTQVVQEQFADFIQESNLDSHQISFINLLIEFLTKNGVIDRRSLVQAPFTNTHDKGIIGVFESNTNLIPQIVSIINRVNANAEAS